MLLMRIQSVFVNNCHACDDRKLALSLSVMTMDAPYNIALLSEYTYTLDSLPIDLSRNFADLRELDAVLSSTVVSITTKIETLTSMIEQGAASKQDKLWLLTEIAQEAQRLRMGGEDKIRVACQAADNLKGHSNHLRALSEHLPNFNTATLDRKTTYPHISERSYMPPMAIDSGRRRRGQALLTAQAAASANGHVDPSPAKRKRIQRDDDVDVGMSRSPKKPTNADANVRARNNGRAKKCVMLKFYSPILLLIICQNRAGRLAVGVDTVRYIPPAPATIWGSS